MKVRENGWYRVETYTTTSSGARYVATMTQGERPRLQSHLGDARGSSSAWPADRDKLPELYGVLTPATAMGDALLGQHPEAGISLDVAKLN